MIRKHWRRIEGMVKIVGEMERCGETEGKRGEGRGEGEGEGEGRGKG